MTMDTLQPCSPNTPWCITAATTAVAVRTGSVNVYAQRRGAAAAENGHLVYLGSLPSGAVILPVPTTVLGCSIIAIGNTETAIELLGDVSNTVQPSLTAGIAMWLDMLLDACETDQVRTSNHLPLAANGTVSVQQHRTLTPHQRTVWCPSADVQPTVAALARQVDTYIPVSRVVPAVALRDTHLTPCHTEAVLAHIRLTDALDIVLRYLEHRLAAFLAEEAEQARRAIDGRIQLREQAVTAGLSRLAAVGTDAVGSMPPISGNPLVAIAGRIALQLQTPLHVPPTWTSTDIDTIDRLLEHSRIRTRSVVLPEGWYRFAGYPMVGYHTDGRIVAFIQAGGGSYQAWYADGTVEPVDALSASQFMSNALQVYRPLPATPLSGRSLLRFALAPVRSDLRVILLAGVAGGLLSLFIPSITGVIVDQVIPMTQRNQLVLIAIGIALAAIVKGLFDLTRDIAVLRVQLATDVSLQAALWDRLLSLPATFFRRFTAGELATRAQGLGTIQTLLAGTTATSLVAFVFSIFQIGLLFYRSSTLAWYAVLILALTLLALLGISYGRYRMILRVQEVYQTISGMILQFLSAIGKLRATASENAAFNLWADTFAEQRNAEYRSTRLQNVSLILNLVVPTIASMVFYWGINDMAKAGEAVNIGDLLSFTTAFTLFWASMQAFVTAFETLLMCIPLYANAKPILDMYPEIDEGKPDPGMITGRIDFNGITFRYDSDGPTILDNVSFSIQPGEFVALVGPSGSGKSTTLRLLLGFEQPEAGSIYVDGMDIRDVNIRSIRRQMGVVIQNGKVLSGDIGKNIIGASTTLTYDDAWEAAKAAGFDQDIRDMPMGMHTVISEGGGALSGGQRQRLLIARALAGKPRVVLMDEATSALDNRTQQIVTDSLGRMNVTRMVIAHRLSTVAQADRIIVLQSGRIVEQGSYAELMALDGVFTAMARRQIA